MNITSEQLKQTLAKMLPDVVHLDLKGNMWWNTAQHVEMAGYPVSDTELLHLCWIIEQSFIEDGTKVEIYFEALHENAKASDFVFHSSWQQRVIALAKVNGIFL